MKIFRTVLITLTLIFSSVAFSTTPAVAEPQPVCVDTGTVDESGQPNLKCTLVDSGLPICSDSLKFGTPCQLAAGDTNFIDCTPNGGALPWECTALEDQDAAGEDNSISIPNFSVTPGAAGTPTKLNFEEVLAAIGPFALKDIIYINYGDGSAFGSKDNLQKPAAAPKTHIYDKPGTYTINVFAYVTDGPDEYYDSDSVTFDIIANSSAPAPTVTATPAPAAVTKEALGIEVTEKSGTTTTGAGSTSPSASATPTQVQSAGPVQTVVTAVTSVFRSIRNFLGF
jgi:hypothetical protein